VKWFAALVVLVAVTGGLFLLTYDDGGLVLGMRPVCMGAGADQPCWITGGGFGVLALGAGVGVVAIGLYGAGLLFATGQLAAGLLVVGQLAIGVVGFLGQVATGLVGMGQGGVGALTVTQGGDNAEGKAFLKQLSAEMGEALRAW